MTVRWVRYASALVAWILLVSARCWGRSTKYSTKTTADYYLGDISFSVNTALRGDIFLKNNSHVMMVDFEGDTPGVKVWEATAKSSSDRVMYWYRPWGELSGYVRRRYNNRC
jgi:hypothetical protein